MPIIDSLSTASAAVGDEVRFFGSDFVTPDLGWVDVTFRGEYVGQDGTRESVDMTLALQADSENEVVWPNFGGYQIPFTPSGSKLGHFEGHVYATNRYFDGTYTPQDGTTWSLVRLDVDPSIVVLDFRGVSDTWIADCQFPATNAIQGLPYMMRVRGVGLEVNSFTFAITPGLVVDGDVSTESSRYDGPAVNNEHALEMEFGAVPYYKDGYRMTVVVAAEAADGTSANLEYPFLVRRPVQPFFNTKMEVAQIYQPVQVSGCIPGGSSSIATTYSETSSETRTRTQGHEARSGWTEDYGMQHANTWGGSQSVGGRETESETVTATDTRTRGGSVTQTDAFSSSQSRSSQTTFNLTDTNSTNYSSTVGEESHGSTTQSGEVNAGAKFGVGPVGVNVGGSYTYARTAGGSESSSNTNGGASGTSLSAGGSHSSSASTSESRSRAENAHWSQSQTHSEANSFSTEQNWNSTANYSEGLTESINLGTSFAEAYTESLSVSSMESESLSVTSNVWAGQQGAWFRQTTRLVRRGVLVAYDLCGNGNEVGPVSVTDWVWSPDLATGDTCPPAPNFPEAECRIPPCEGR